MGAQASFTAPTGMAVVGGHAYTIDSQRVRRIDLATREVSTVAGGRAVTGCADTDGSLPAAVSSAVNQSVVSDGKRLYWIDTCHPAGVIRSMDLTTGNVASVPSSNLYANFLSIDAAGRLVAVINGEIYRVDQDTGGRTKIASLSRNGQIVGFTADNENFWVSRRDEDAKLTSIERVSASGTAHRLVSAPTLTVWQTSVGYQLDGKLTSAGNDLFVQRRNYVLRVTKSTGDWDLVAGVDTPGFVDGVGTRAWFTALAGMDTDGSRLWVLDGTRLRTIDPGTPLPAHLPSAWATSLDLGSVAPVVVSGRNDGDYAGGPADEFGAGTDSLAFGLAILDGYGYSVEDRGRMRRTDLRTGESTILAGWRPATGSSDACTDSSDPRQSVLGPAHAKTVVSDGTFIYWLDINCAKGHGGGVLRRFDPVTGAVSVVAGRVGGEALTVGPAGKIYIQGCGGICTLDRRTGSLVKVADFKGLNVKGDDLHTPIVTSLAADQTHVYARVQNGRGGNWLPYPYAVLKTALADGNVSVLTQNHGYKYGGYQLMDNNLVSAGGELYLPGLPPTTNPSGPTARMLLNVDKTSGLTKPISGVAAIEGMDTDGKNLFVMISGRLLRLDRVRGPSRLPDAAAPEFPASGLGPSEAPAGSDPSGSSACGQGQATEWPVNTRNGAFWHTFDDLKTPGRGPCLSVSRTYVSSNSAQDGSFGRGWSWSYGMRLTEDAPAGLVTLRQEDGSAVGFKHAADGSFAPARARMLASLERRDDGTYRVVRRQRELLDFDAEGRLIGVGDLNGNTNRLAYDSAGRLTSITNDGGRAYAVSTNADGQIVRIADGAANAYVYDYSGGDLVSVTDPSGARTSFTYDANHRMLTITDPNQQDDEAPRSLTNVYDSQGRMTSQTDFEGRATKFSYRTYDGRDWTTVTDPDGEQTVDEYSQSRGMRTNTQKQLTRGQWATTSFTYDPVTFALASVTDPRGKVSSFTYDGRGNLLSSRDPLGRVTRHTYDNLNSRLTTTGADGVTTTSTFDARGNRLTSSRPLLDAGGDEVGRATLRYAYDDPAYPGQLTSFTDAKGNTTRYAYNTFGDLTTTTSPATPDQPTGSVATAEYDPDTGWMTAQVAARGNAPGAQPTAHRTRFVYDQVGRLVQTRLPGWDASDPDKRRTRAVYDDNGNLTQSVDVLGRETSHSYDGEGRPLSTTRPDGATLSQAYTPDGQLASTTDAAGKTTTYTYAGGDMLTKVTDPLNRATEYTHDLGGNVVSVQAPGGSCPNGQGCTRLTYDDAGQLTRTRYADQTTPVDQTYDQLGRVTTLTDTTGTSTSGYDSLGRLTKTTDGHGVTVGYRYDLNGNRTTIIHPGNREVTNTYDAQNRLSEVTDWNQATTGFDYDSGGMVAARFPNGLRTDYGHDDDGAITDITISRAQTGGGSGSGATPTTVASFAYTRNDASQVTGTTETDVPTAGASTTSTTPVQTAYVYDQLGQLTKVDGQSVFGYDAAHRVTALAGGTTLAYDEASQLTTSTRAGATTTHQYDTRGNRTQSTSTAGTRTYQTNLAGDLTQVTTNPAGGAPADTVTAAYDGHGLRVSRTQGGETQRFAYDQSGQLPLVIDDTDHAYIYGPGQLPIAQIDNDTDQTTYLHSDQLGSTRVLTDDDGDVAGTYTYDLYGQTTAHTGTTSTRLRFNAQYLDVDTNLYWLRARHYDPTTAQFITRDPYEAATGQPYAYAANDPLNHDDPAGLWPSLTDILTTGWSGAVVNFMIGVGDSASLGLTGYIREAISPGSTCTIDTNSLAYRSGYGGADALSMATGAGGIGRGAIKSAVRGASRKGHPGRHQFPGVRPRKSQFYDGVDMASLARTGGTVGVRQSNGNYRYVMHSDREVGIDRATGLPTNIYTVIRRDDGSLLTMFPGTSPRS